MCAKHVTKSLASARHQQAPIGEKPLRYRDCSKAISQKITSVLHQRTYPGEKSYAGNACGKDFSVNSQFIHHQVPHTRERSCLCKECGKDFTQNLHLPKYQRKLIHGRIAAKSSSRKPAQIHISGSTPRQNPHEWEKSCRKSSS